MKRSEINNVIRQTIEFLQTMNFYLPKWAFWTPDEWKGKGALVNEIVDCGLGWDITDFGSGDFSKIGLVNFNLRNGVMNQTRKNYCEKIIVVNEDQVTPLHTHYQKFEDIINRGGGNLVIKLYQGDNNFNLTAKPVKVKIDGIPHKIAAGGQVVLTPGDSIFLEPGVLHEFFGQPGAGQVLVGEVSAVNDDNTDNYFVGQNTPRFPTIVEDTEPEYLLVNDYLKYL
jgi:D-lyxose ketol-isomerase